MCEGRGDRQEREFGDLRFEGRRRGREEGKSVFPGKLTRRLRSGRGERQLKLLHKRDGGFQS